MSKRKYKRMNLNPRALRTAAATGNPEVVRMILDAGAEKGVCAREASVGPAIKEATRNGSAEIVRMLVEAKAKAEETKV